MQFNTRYVVNAKQEKKALNLGITHQFSEHWSVAATYSYLAEKIKAKGNYTIDYGNIKFGVDNMLNKINIPNQYTLDVSYTTDKFNTSLSTLMYAGASTECYTDNRFIIVNWNANYDIRKDLTVYCSVENLFNEAYQTKFYAHTGKGAYPGLGRNFMIGARYKF